MIIGTGLFILVVGALILFGKDDGCCCGGLLILGVLLGLITLI